MTTKPLLKTYFEEGKEPTESQFHEWMDSYWHKEETLPTDQTYKTISANTVLDDTFHNCIICITINSTITVPNTLKAGFNCVFDAVGNVTGAFVEGSGATFSAPFGKILKDNGMCTLYRLTSNIFRLNGGLSVNQA